MRSLKKIHILALAGFLIAGTQQSYAQGEGRPTAVVAGEYIIKRESAPSFSALTPSVPTDEIEIAHTAPLTRLLQSTPLAVENLDSTKAAVDCALLQMDPTVTLCEPNYIYTTAATPNDPGFIDQWPLRSSLDTPNIGAETAWDTTTGNQGIVVGIIDSGINYGHSDLQPNLWINPFESGANFDNGIDDDSNGYIDDLIGINAITSDNSPWDCVGHGSHVAGIIGARGNNGIGVTGVNWNVRMVPVRVGFCDTSGTLSLDGILRGIDYLIDLKRRHGINLVAVNASFGREGPPSQFEYEYIRKLRDENIIFVTAAGNGGDDQLGDNIDQVTSYPAAYDLDNIVTVSNSTVTGNLDSSSNYGTIGADLAAPGTDIVSTYRANSSVDFDTYASLTGTSMSAPHVTGALALLASVQPSATYKQRISYLLGSATRSPLLAATSRTDGYLNLPGLLSNFTGVASCPPASLKQLPGACGCDVLDTDSDTDGWADCLDLCPSDTLKSTAGICGCGLPDTDQDGDGVLDCVDSCATDKTKISPGVCGCGVADTDSDLDGRVDCTVNPVQVLTPIRPTLKVRSNKLIVSLSRYSSAQYLVEVRTRPAKRAGRARTYVLSFDSPRATIRGLKRGTRVSVRYLYQLTIGGMTISSQWSKAKSLVLS